MRRFHWGRRPGARYRSKGWRELVREDGNCYWGGRTRTSNFPVNSRAVCQLTYTPLNDPDAADAAAPLRPGSITKHDLWELSMNVDLLSTSDPPSRRSSLLLPAPPG